MDEIDFETYGYEEQQQREQPQQAQQQHEENREDSEYVFLHQYSKIEWKHLYKKLLDIQHTDSWKILVIACIIFSIFCFTFYFVFMIEPLDRSIRVYLYICDIVFAANYVMALTAYFRKDVETVYGRPRLIVDFILCGPQVYIYKWFDDDIHILFFLRCTQFPRYYYLIMFFREKQTEAGINHWKYFMTNYLQSIVLLHHFIACCWCMAGRTRELHVSGWAEEYLKPAIYKDTWMMYRTCLYYALQVTTARGFQICNPENTLERLITILANILGFAYATGVYMGPMVADHIKRVKRRAMLRIQLRNINTHLSRIRQMDKKTMYDINVYYKTLWKEKKGVVDARALNLLPFPLRTEICFDINIQPLLNSLLFYDKPEYFLRMIAYKMKHEFYPPGMMIFHQGVVKNKMIFVVMGTIQILSEEDNQSPIITFGPGTCLGAPSLVTTLPAKASVKAATYTELQVLNREDFLQTIQLYPDMYQDIFKDIYKRITDVKVKRSKQKNVTSISMSLFVSQYENLTPIKILKEKLLSGKLQDDSGLGRSVIYKLGSNVASRKRVPLCMTEKFPWVIHPQSSFTRVWEVIIFVTTLLICALYPYCVAFHRTFPDWVRIISIFLEFILVLDIYVIITTALIRKNKVVTSVIEIFQTKMIQPGFYFDALACVHIELFALVIADGSQQDRMFFTLKLNRLLKSYRLYTFVTQLENQIQIRVAYINSVKYTLMVLLWLLLVAPILYMLSCYNIICTNDGWYFLQLLEDLEEAHEEPCTQYPIGFSYYFALSVIVGSTAGDVYARNTPEIIVLYIVIIISVLLNGFCVARMAASISLRLRTRDNFYGFLHSARAYLRDKNVSKSLRVRVFNYFVLQWDHNAGVDLSENSLFYNASKKIQSDVLLKERMDKLLKLPLFQDTNLDFVQLIVTGAKTLVLPPNEYVTYIGSMIPELFIIEEGNCIQFDYDRSAKILKPGDHFGTLAILNSSPCLRTIQTVTHVKLISISERLFKTATSMFPSIRNIFQEVIGEAFKTNSYKKLLAAAEDAMKEDFHEEHTSVVNSELEGSFINVYGYCQRHGQDYSEPFDSIRYMSFLKYTILPICILPNGLFLKVWMSLRVTACIIVAFVYPYQLALSPYAPILDRTILYLDVVAYVDLYVMLLVGYYGKRKQLIFHPLKTANHYLQGKFLLDVLLCMPYELLVKLMMPSHNEHHTPAAHEASPHQLHCVFRYSRILQVYRVWQAKQYIQAGVHKKKAIWVMIVFYFLVTIMLINLGASLVIAYECRHVHLSDVHPGLKRWVDASVKHMREEFKDIDIPDYSMICQKNSWLFRFKLHTLKAQTIYMYAMFYTADYMLAVGCGVFTPQDRYLVIATMIVVFISYMCFMYVYGNILSYRVTLYDALAQNQEMAIELKKFMDRQHVNRKLQRVIFEYFEYLWKRTRGAEPHVVLSHLHSALHEGTVLDMYSKIFKEVPLFDGVDNTFFALLGQAVHEKYYLRGYIVIKSDDVVEHVYILFRGKVEIVSSLDHSVTRMGPGGLFGNITKQHKRKIKLNVIASTNIDVLSVKSDVFYDTVKKYPIVEENVREANRSGADFVLPSHEIEDEGAESGIIRLPHITSSSLFSYGNQSDTSGIEYHSGSSMSLRSRITLATATLTYTRQHRYMSLYLIFLPHKWGRVAILPNDKIYEWIKIMSIVVAYVNCILVLHQFAFRYHIIINHELIVVIFVDVVFVLKNFLEMHKAYEDQFGDYITDNRKIIKKFFEHKWKTTIELSANLPLYYLAFFSAILTEGSNPNVVFCNLRLITFLRCMYIIDYFKEASNKLLIHRTFLKIGIVFVYYTLIVHTMACLLYIVSCPMGECKQYSWMIFSNDDYETYFRCLFIMVDMFTLSSNSLIKPQVDDDFVVCLFYLVLVKFIVGFFVGDIANVVSSSDSSLNSYEQEICELRDYLHNENLSEFQMNKMWNYLKHLWRRNTGKQTPRSIQHLPFSLRCDLMMDIYGHHLKNSYVFAGAEESFIRQLSAHLKHIVLFPGNYVVQHGDSNLSMYIIHTGKIDVLTVHSNLTETIHEVLVAGDMFGLNQGMFHGVPHIFSYRARTVVDIVRLYLPHWEELMNFFPVSKQLIYKRAQEVYTKI